MMMMMMMMMTTKQRLVAGMVTDCACGGAGGGDARHASDHGQNPAGGGAREDRGLLSALQRQQHGDTAALAAPGHWLVLGSDLPACTASANHSRLNRVTIYIYK